MNELYNTACELNVISDKLDKIRKLSKGLIPDYRHYPYDSDTRLICFLLDEKIDELEKEQ